MQGSLFLFCSSVAELCSALKILSLSAFSSAFLSVCLGVYVSLPSLFLFLSVHLSTPSSSSSLSISSFLYPPLPLLLYPSPPPPSPSSSPLRPSRLWQSLPMNWPLRRMSLSLTLTHSLPPLKQSSPKSWRLQTGQAFTGERKGTNLVYNWHNLSYVYLPLSCIPCTPWFYS